jgi:hypothetical protein
MIFSVARVLQLFLSPSISLFAYSRVTALVSNPNVKPISDAPPPDDASVLVPSCAYFIIRTQSLSARSF